MLQASESTVCSSFAESADEGKLPAAPVIISPWDATSSLDEGRVSILGRVVYTHTEVLIQCTYRE